MKDYSTTFSDMAVKNKEVFVLCERGKEHLVTAESPLTNKGKKNIAKSEASEMKESEAQSSPE